MDEFLKMAMEMIRAQAGVRAMTPEEIVQQVQILAEKLRNLAEGRQQEDIDPENTSKMPGDSKKSIKEKSITCLECGKSFKLITAKHLNGHGLSAKEYREKHGLKKGTTLAAKKLVRSRKNKMLQMELWKKRGKTVVVENAATTETEKKKPSGGKTKKKKASTQ